MKINRQKLVINEIKEENNNLNLVFGNKINEINNVINCSNFEGNNLLERHFEDVRFGNKINEKKEKDEEINPNN